MRRPRNVVQYSFEGGEADPEFERRADADLWGLTAKRMRNVRLTYGGGFTRRPGLARVMALTGNSRVVPFLSRAGTERLLAFRDGQIDVINPAGSIVATINPSGIAAAYLHTMQIAQFDDRLIIASRGFFPRELTWNEGTASFSIGDFDFETRTDNSRGWPYYRFRETRGITITPSALTGTGITLQASGAVFNAGHVGVRFTLLNREVQITAVADADTATADVIQELYPTRRLTVGSTKGFAAGQIVQDSVGDIEMEVASVVSATQLDVILIDTFTDPGTSSNNLLGPAGATPLTAVGAASPGGTIQWKEQLISGYRGYPAAVATHKDRLIFADFAGAPELHAMSIIGTPEDFDTGDGLDDEAIIEGPGDAKGKRVLQLVSMEQLITLTENGSYYIGEGPGTPLTPANVEFLPIGPEKATTCNTVKTAEGVVFAESEADRLMLLTATGQLRRAWSGTELLGAASDLFNSPSRLLLVDGSDLGPERYILAVNSDGSICCVHYRRDSELAGAALWTTEGGSFVDLCMWQGSVHAVVNRSGSFTLERFDNDRLLDNSILFTHAGGTTPTNATLASRQDIALVWRKTVNGEARRADLGNLYDCTAGGVITGAPTTGPRDYEAGNRFSVLAKPWPPIDPEFGPSEYQRVAGASIDILDSGIFYAMGQALSPYRAVDDITEPPPLRSGWRKKKYMGRKRDWNFEISQIEAAPLTVRVLTLEVR